MKLIAPPHTPMHANGSLNLEIIPRQVEHFLEAGVLGAFVGGSTGESQSLTIPERLELHARWCDVAGASTLSVFLQVGHNCQKDAVALAEQARRLRGVDAIAAHPPSFFKPQTVDDLIDYCVPIAAAAGDLPFYYYHIPVLSGVPLPMLEFLEKAKSRLPTLAGLKYTHNDLMELQECLRLDEGAFEILFGRDELMLAGYALGARGAVGSSYNFAAPLYLKVIASFESNNEQRARQLQAQSVQMIRILASYGYMGAAKSVMRMFGIDCGPVRSPNRNLSESQVAELFARLRELEYFASL